MRGTDDRCNFRGVPGGRRATSVFSIAGEDLEHAWPFGALPRSGSGVLGRRALICSPPALERLFIASPWAEGHRSRSNGGAGSKVACSKRLMDRYDANSSSSAFASFRSRVSNPSVNHP
jgi:hypothetical protein